ncbi:unnamed protein product, partial [Ascophyllum nodosum]
MVNIYKKKCRHEGCLKIPSFGLPGSMGPKFCSPHAAEGMVDIRNRCRHEGCTVNRSFGFAGSKKMEFCSRHAQEGMINMRHKRCLHEGCSKHASYGAAGSKRTDFCAQHVPEGLVDVKSKRCKREGCSKTSSFGVAGRRTPEFCAQHAEEGMVAVKSRCCHAGCSRRPLLRVAGRKKAEFCAKHAALETTGEITKRIDRADHGTKRPERSDGNARNPRTFLAPGRVESSRALAGSDRVPNESVPSSSMIESEVPAERDSGRPKRRNSDQSSTSTAAEAWSGGDSKREHLSFSARTPNAINDDDAVPSPPIDRKRLKV